MSEIGEILQLSLKPKEKVSRLANWLKNQPNLTSLIGYYNDAKDSEKGACLSAITAIAKDDANFIAGHIDFIVKQLSHKAPRVKWEANEIVAYSSKIFSGKLNLVVPKLLENSKNEGTVVRWSAAYALTEIAKNNPGLRDKLTGVFKKILKTEKQNGVRNIYLKTLKSFGR